MNTNTRKTSKKWLWGAFIALALALAGTLLLPNPVVLATNSYINNIHFYVDDNGLLREHFFVLQDITQTYYLQGTNICWATTSWVDNGVLWKNAQHSDYGGFQILPSEYVNYGAGTAGCPATAFVPTPYTFLAGNSYDVYLVLSDSWLTNSFQYYGIWPANIFSTIYEFNTWKYSVISETTLFPYEPTWRPVIPPTNPEVYITYPHPNQTNILNTTFVIEGSYINPNGLYNYLIANVYDSNHNFVGQLYSWISGSTDGDLLPVDFSWNSGLGAGEYSVEIGFANTTNGALVYTGQYSPYTIYAQEDLVPRLPNQEIPPRTYTGTDPAIYYTNNSQYATSTPLYNSLSGSIAPMIETIGQNLQFFSYKFPIGNAQLLGTNIGTAIQTANGYATNLNQLFGTLPIVEIFGFYLALLILVSVFRIIKSLINLIKI